MSATSPLEPFGSPKSTNSDESSTFDEAASTAASSTCADDSSATTATPTESECGGDNNASNDSAASNNPLKRKRRLSSTSCSAPCADNDDDAPTTTTTTTTTTPTTLSRALHVLATEATALAHISQLYSTSPGAQAALLAAVGLVERANRRGGKVVVCGVGKSGLVGRKTVATMKSLGLGASFLHAAEAVHGDLGDVRGAGRDVVLFISFSGRTAELVSLLPHLPPGAPVVALTAHADAATCPLLQGRRGGDGDDEGVLLPAPIHESEELSFGVAAPTTSTTVAMAVGDMLALTAAERIHAGEKGRVFKRNHPGGAIGARTLAEEVMTVVKTTKKVCVAGGVEC